MEPFAVIVPTEADLTAPVAAATELSKLYITAAKHASDLMQQVWTEEVDGHTVIHEPPQLRWWFDQARKLLTDIAKINVSAEAKAIDQKINLLNIFMNSKEVPEDIRRDLAIRAMKEKMKNER